MQQVNGGGVIGLMTQKLSEAEALLYAGVLYGDKNILISQELADPTKIEKVVGMNVAIGEGKVLILLLTTLTLLSFLKGRS